MPAGAKPTLLRLQIGGQRFAEPLVRRRMGRDLNRRSAGVLRGDAGEDGADIHRRSSGEEREGRRDARVCP